MSATYLSFTYEISLRPSTDDSIKLVDLTESLWPNPACL